jgi:hypothetical protein
MKQAFPETTVSSVGHVSITPPAQQKSVRRTRANKKNANTAVTADYSALVKLPLTGDQSYQPNLCFHVPKKAYQAGGSPVMKGDVTYRPEFIEVGETTGGSLRRPRRVGVTSQTHWLKIINPGDEQVVTRGLTLPLLERTIPAAPTNVSHEADPHEDDSLLWDYVVRMQTPGAIPSDRMIWTVEFPRAVDRKVMENAEPYTLRDSLGSISYNLSRKWEKLPVGEMPPRLLLCEAARLVDLLKPNIAHIDSPEERFYLTYSKEKTWQFDPADTRVNSGTDGDGNTVLTRLRLAVIGPQAANSKLSISRNVGSDDAPINSTFQYHSLEVSPGEPAYPSIFRSSLPIASGAASVDQIQSHLARLLHGVTGTAPVHLTVQGRIATPKSASPDANVRPPDQYWSYHPLTLATNFEVGDASSAITAAQRIAEEITQALRAVTVDVEPNARALSLDITVRSSEYDKIGTVRLIVDQNRYLVV